MRPAVGAYSGPRVTRGVVAHPARNATHVTAAMRRIRIDVFEFRVFMKLYVHELNASIPLQQHCCRSIVFSARLNLPQPLYRGSAEYWRSNVDAGCVSAPRLFADS